MLTSCIYAAVKYANILPLFRGPSSEAAWPPLFLSFFFSLKFCKSHTAALTVSRKLIEFAGMVTNNPLYP